MDSAINNMLVMSYFLNSFEFSEYRFASPSGFLRGTLQKKEKTSREAFLALRYAAAFRECPNPNGIAIPNVSCVHLPCQGGFNRVRIRGSM